MTQLGLFAVHRPQDLRLIELGILRHSEHDIDDHQRGFIRLPHDTAGGRRKGELIPAWICCQCGEAEPSAYWLGIEHACASIHGSRVAHELRARPGGQLYRWPIADTGEVAAGHAVLRHRVRPEGA